MTIKAVLFDFDDTLGDREVYAYRTYAQALDEHYPGLDPLTRESALQQCMVLDQQGDVSKEFVRNGLLKTQGLDLGEDLQAWWYQNQGRHAVLFDDTLDTLKTLKEKGYLLGIVTNGSVVSQNMKIDTTGIREYFDAIVVSGEVNVHKPDPEIFRIAAERLHVKCGECIFVGDLYYRDVIGAARAGMKPVWIWAHGKRLCMNPDIPHITRISSLLDVMPDILKSE
ncbi:MAG: HAD family hydrolase [Bulleidia sp.]|nr:HAD family hydrolase [Bulleidia sp.]